MNMAITWNNMGVERIFGEVYQLAIGHNINRISILLSCFCSLFQAAILIEILSTCVPENPSCLILVVMVIPVMFQENTMMLV